MVKNPQGLQFYIGSCVAFSLQENGFAVHTFYWTARNLADAETKLTKMMEETLPKTTYHRHEYVMEEVPEKDIEEIMQCIRPPILTEHVAHEGVARRGRSLVIS